MSSNLRFYSFPSGLDPLATLADAVRDGFPVEGEKLPLHRWTIFLPTRRAVRALSLKFHDKHGRDKTLLLPHVRPIDDFDEDIIQLNSAEDLPQALPEQAQVFLLTAFVKTWAATEPHHEIAQDVVSSDLRAFGLAQSLGQLIDQMETEDIPLSQLGEAYDFGELAEHRDAILSLFSIVKDYYPAELAKHGLMGRAARRNEVIRLQAKYIASGMFKGPVVAAGSTGSNPATRELLKAIAQHPQGAVILPGLDLAMTDAEWMKLDPTHPQYGLSQLLQTLDVARSDVKEIGAASGARLWLAREVMRSTETTDQWKDTVASGEVQVDAALKTVTFVEADNRHLEARAIALKLREVLETPAKTAVLITPDRDLSQRVKAEMLRWNIVIDDTAGEPLTRFGLAALTLALHECVSTGFAAGALLQVLHHPMVNLGLDQESYSKSARHLELVAFRQQGFEGGLANVLHARKRAEIERQTDPHLHPVVKRLTEEDWAALCDIADRFCAILAPLETMAKMALQESLELLKTALAALAPDADWEDQAHQALSDLFEAFSQATKFSPQLSLHDALTMMATLMRKESLRDAQDVHPRLAILGLAEARMLRPDVVVLGGLNEGKWPQQVDPGPWLNRGMREKIGLQVPERSIGLTAHDFVEAFTHGEVMLTWSKRDQQQPLVPSRWILRLRMLMEGVGIDFKERKRPHISFQAALIDTPQGATEPLSKPRPTPNPKLRPTKFSVTEIVKLNRDPYHIYARRILNLQPIEKLGAEADARLRGTLFHDAIGRWNAAQPISLDPETLRLLVQHGEKVLAPLRSDRGLYLFWSLRFHRIATWLVENEPALRAHTLSVHAEKRGKKSFTINGKTYELRGVADRIDLLGSGARIIDYKTSAGAVPSNKVVLAGWDPQLTLEAALLQQGGFDGIAPVSVTELAYVTVSGSAAADKTSFVTPENKETIFGLADRHFEGLKQKLAIMADAETPYLPRVHLQRVEDASDYDHLSRHLEWRLAETS